MPSDKKIKAQWHCVTWSALQNVGMVKSKINSEAVLCPKQMANSLTVGSKFWTSKCYCSWYSAGHWLGVLDNMWLPICTNF